MYLSLAIGLYYNQSSLPVLNDTWLVYGRGWGKCKYLVFVQYGFVAAPLHVKQYIITSMKLDHHFEYTLIENVEERKYILEITVE